MSVVKTSTSERLPHSPKGWPAEAFVWWRSLLLALSLIGIIYVASYALMLVMFAFGALQRADLTVSHFSWAVFDLQLAGTVAAVAAILVVLPRLAHCSLADLGLRMPRLADVSWGLIGAIVM